MAKSHLPVATATTAAAVTPSLGLTAYGKCFEYTLGANLTVGAMTGFHPGQLVIFTFVQDATGGRTVTFDASYKLGTAWSNTGNTAGKASSIAFVVSPRSTSSVPVLEQFGPQVAYH